ncbi:MAG: transposase [Saprospiraceae bacterium]|nr:transposase [Saprospiraceae bacterium]
MEFYKNQIFHVYNQGNDRQKIFFKDDNYLYFLKKMRQFVCPYADFLAYCLMPNHFHFLIYVRETELFKEKPKPKTTTLNESIGTMLMSYTSAINKQENRIGSLFRQHTKAEDGWIDDVISIGSKNQKLIFSPDINYGMICFEYIHNNPVKAKLVLSQENWKYSSARDYLGIRNGTLCDQILAKELLNLENLIR